MAEYSEDTIVDLQALIEKILKGDKNARRDLVRRTELRLRRIAQNLLTGKRLSAHSQGTEIVNEQLARLDDKKWDRVFFGGGTLAPLENVGDDAQVRALLKKMGDKEDPAPLKNVKEYFRRAGYVMRDEISEVFRKIYKPKRARKTTLRAAIQKFILDEEKSIAHKSKAAASEHEKIREIMNELDPSISAFLKARVLHAGYVSDEEWKLVKDKLPAEKHAKKDDDDGCLRFVSIDNNLRNDSDDELMEDADRNHGGDSGDASDELSDDETEGDLKEDTGGDLIRRADDVSRLEVVVQVMELINSLPDGVREVADYFMFNDGFKNALRAWIHPGVRKEAKEQEKKSKDLLKKKNRGKDPSKACAKFLGIEPEEVDLRVLQIFEAINTRHELKGLKVLAELGEFGPNPLD